MKPLYNARHVTEAHLIRGYLESQGVPAIVRGEFLAGGIGELPVDVCRVWVMNDGDLARADVLVRDFMRGAAAQSQAHWRCGQCGEVLEGQFTACWNCGGARAAS
jgi:Putative prokaryotic signal transducing protein